MTKLTNQWLTVHREAAKTHGLSPEAAEALFTAYDAVQADLANAQASHADTCDETHGLRVELDEERARRQIDDRRVEEFIQKLHAAEAARDAFGCALDAAEQHVEIANAAATDWHSRYKQVAACLSELGGVNCALLDRNQTLTKERDATKAQLLASGAAARNEIAALLREISELTDRLIAMSDVTETCEHCDQDVRVAIAALKEQS